MTLNYSLLFVLFVLFPGFSFWAGWRIGERTDNFTPAPERPRSTSTLLFVLVGALLGHGAGSLLFWLNDIWCDATGLCAALKTQPNIYRLVYESVHGALSVTPEPSIMVLVAIGSLLLIGFLAYLLAFKASRAAFVTRFSDPIAFGWLNEGADAIKKGGTVVAHVLTSLAHEGRQVAYEGELVNVALHHDNSIKMLVLRDADRFLVRMGKDSISRIDIGSAPIPTLQIAAEQIANVAIEVFVPKSKAP